MHFRGITGQVYLWLSVGKSTETERVQRAGSHRSAGGEAGCLTWGQEGERVREGPDFEID